MGQFTYIFVDSENKKHTVWIQASSWKVAGDRFYKQHKNVKEVIRAKRQS